MKRRHETGFGPGEINIKPPLCLPEKWEVFFDMLRVKMIGQSPVRPVSSPASRMPPSGD